MTAVKLRRLVAASISTVILSLSLVVGSGTFGWAADGTAPVDAVIAPPDAQSVLATLQAGADALLPAEPGPETAAAVMSPAKVRLPACQIADQQTRYQKVREWKKSLLDTNLRLRRSYQPWDLVSVRRAGLAGSGKVRKLMIADLHALAAAARTAGKPLAVRSAWRSYDYQKALFASYVRTHGYDRAIRFSARPGHSEHQLGTTIDFTVGPGVPLSTSFGDSPSGKWLERHGWEYGFIMSYPKGKRSVSCYSYEPWHWRYFGRKLAARIHESGQVPRRYLYEHFVLAP